MNNRNHTAILLWGILVSACVLTLFNYAKFDTSLITIFSSDADDSNAANASLLQLGPASRLVLGSLKGTEADSLAQTSIKLIDSLKETQEYPFVSNGRAEPALTKENPLFAYRYILSSSTNSSSFDVRSLKEAFTSAYQALRSPFSLVDKSILPYDPTGTWYQFLSSLRGDTLPDRHQGVWFSKDKSQALFIALLPDTGTRIDDTERHVARIKNTFFQLTSDDLKKPTLTLAGPAVFAVNSRDTIRSETQKLSLGATLAIIALLFFAFRSVRLVLISAIPVVTAVLVAVTTVNLLFGSIHGVTLAFGVTLLGVVIDYPIHLFSHARNDKNISESVQNIWPTIRLGMYTTVSAYLAMALASIPGLAQLGTFAMSGIIAGAMTTRWVIPALSSSTGRSLPGFLPTSITNNLSGQNRYIAIGSIGLSIAIIMAAGFTTQHALWQPDLRQFSSVPAEAMKQYRDLKSHFNMRDTADIILVSSDNVESALQITEEVSEKLMPLVKVGHIGSFDSASRYLPSRETQLQRRDSLPESGALSTTVNQALNGLPYKQGYFDPFILSIAESKNLDPIVPPGKLTEPGALLGNKLSSLLFHIQGQWFSIIPLHNLKNESLLRTTLASFPGDRSISIRYFNITDEQTHLMDQYLDETFNRILWGALIVMVVLWAGIRSWPRFLRVILPITLALTVTVAILLLDDVSLSIFHIIALLLTTGISIDYALFLSRESRANQDRHNTLTAIIVCVLSTITVFGILGTSDIPVLEAIGKTVSIGVITAFILTTTLSQYKTSHPVVK